MPRYEPPRGGNRGGQDQFEWEDVRVDKHRENYLGHSVMAPTGRWQKGKDLTWYTKGSKVTGQREKIKAEVAAIKRAEEEAMAAALGLKPPAPVKPQQALTKQEIAEVCRRRSTEDGDYTAEERMKGVGFQSRRAQLMYSGTETTTTKEGATVFEHDPALDKGDDRLKMGKAGRSATAAAAQRPAEAPHDLTTHREERTEEKEETVVAENKSKKKKRHKKEKKLKKKKKKEKVRSRHDSDSSSEEDRWVQKHHHSDPEKPPQSKKRRHDSDSEGPSERRRGRRERHDSGSEGPPERRRERHHSGSDGHAQKRTAETSSYRDTRDRRRQDYESDRRYRTERNDYRNGSLNFRERDSHTHKRRRRDTYTSSDSD